LVCEGADVLFGLLPDHDSGWDLAEEGVLGPDTMVVALDMPLGVPEK
jgi:hypothetical protein